MAAWSDPRVRALARRWLPWTASVRRGYVHRDLRTDAVAGVTVVALAIPSAMAYAQLAGLSPVAGLYALILPVLAYVALGSSRQIVVGPEGSLSLLLATSLASLAVAGSAGYAALAAMTAVLVGGFAVVARVVRLGWIADYFSRAVLVGYLHGVAVVLIVGQLSKILGIPVTSNDTVEQLRELVTNLDDAQALTVVVGFLSIGLLLLLKSVAPRVPGALVVVVAAIVASWVFGLEDHGVAVVGTIPGGLPSLSWPDVTLAQVVDLLPVALGIFAVGYADHILTARSFAGRHGQHVDANQELLAFGAANLAAGVSGGFPVGASGSRTAVNDQMRVRTQLAGLVSVAVVVAVLLFFTAPFEVLPKATLGAVIIVAAIGLIEPSAWKALREAGGSQVLIAVVTFAGVVVVGVLEALVVAVALSIVDVAVRSAKPHDAVLGYSERLGRWANVTFHPGAKTVAGVVVYRLDDRLFFANCRYFKARVREAVARAETPDAPVRALVFDAEGMVDVDASGVEALEQLVRDLDAAGTTFVLARAKHPVLARLRQTGVLRTIGDDHVFPTVDAAVESVRGA